MGGSVLNIILRCQGVFEGKLIRWVFLGYGLEMTFCVEGVGVNLERDTSLIIH